MRPDQVAAIAVMLAVLALAALVGFLLGRHVYKPVTVAVVETYAKPIDHDDGSSTMARVVDKQPESKPPTTPKGKPAGAIEMVVIPDAPVDGKCAPITMHLALTESEDGGLRVSERVENGETAEAVHYAPPVRHVVTERRWGVGVANMNGDTAAVVERYWPGARFGVVVGEEYRGAELVFRF